jgi:ATP-binding cassette subfamily B protein
MAPAARTYAAALAAQVASTLGLFAAPLFLSAALESLARSQGAEPAGGDRLLEAVGRWLPSADEPVQLVLFAAAGSLVATLISAGFQYLRGRLAAQASEGLVLDLRRQVYDRLQRLPEAWFSDRESGDLVQRATSDVETLRAFLAVQIVEVGRSATLLFVALPILLLLDPFLALISVALYPVIGALAWTFFRRVRARFQAVDEAEGAMTAVLQENLTGVRVVRAFGRGEHERARFASANAAHRDALESWIRLLGRYWGSSDVLCLSQLGLTLFFGASRVLDGQLGVGELFAFVTYAGLLIWPVRQLGRVLSETGKALVAVERLGEVLDAEPEVDVPGARAPVVAPAPGGFAVRGLSVRFDGSSTPALDGLDLELAPGETLALVGPPGAGKSTLLDVLTRLIEPSAGAVEVSGVDALSAPRAWVREQLAVVPQEAFLFSKSLRDNLRAAAEGADDERLWQALEEAAIAGDVRAMERGLDTEVGERGVTLSGGQRQRTTLARALLRETPLLVLDDSLSAVDTATEVAILGALERRSGSALIVTHRLSAARAADRIAVLEAATGAPRKPSSTRL